MASLNSLVNELFDGSIGIAANVGREIGNYTSNFGRYTSHIGEIVNYARNNPLGSLGYAVRGGLLTTLLFIGCKIGDGTPAHYPTQTSTEYPTTTVPMPTVAPTPEIEDTIQKIDEQLEKLGMPIPTNTPELTKLPIPTLMGIFPDGFSVVSDEVALDERQVEIEHYKCLFSSGECHLYIPYNDKITPIGDYFARRDKQGSLYVYMGYPRGVEGPFEESWAGKPNFDEYSRAYNKRITDMLKSAKIIETKPTFEERHLYFLRYKPDEFLLSSDNLSFTFGDIPSWKVSFIVDYIDSETRNCLMLTPVSAYTSDNCNFGDGTMVSLGILGGRPANYRDIQAVRQYMKLLSIDTKDIKGSLDKLVRKVENDSLLSRDYQELFPEVSINDNLIKPIIFFPEDYPTDETIVDYYKSKIREVQHFYAINAGGKTFKTIPITILRGNHDSAWYWCKLGQNGCHPNNFEANVTRELKDRQITKKLLPGWVEPNGLYSVDTNRIYSVFAMGGGGFAGAMTHPEVGHLTIIGDAGVLGKPIITVYENSMEHSYVKKPNILAGTLAHELGHIFGLPHPDFYGYQGSRQWNQTVMGAHWNYPDVGLLPEDKFILLSSKDESILLRTKFLYNINEPKPNTESRPPKINRADN